MPGTLGRTTILALTLAIGATGSAQSDSDLGVRKLSERDRANRMKLLTPEERLLLADLELLFSRAEKDAFLLLDTPDERNRWIADWLDSFDGELDTIRERASIVRMKLPRNSDASRATMLHGLPDERKTVECDGLVVPAEVWRWVDGPVPADAPVLFILDSRSRKPSRLFVPNREDETEIDPREMLLGTRGSSVGFVPVFIGLPESPASDPEPMIVNCPGGAEALEAIRLALTEPHTVAFILEKLSARRKLEERAERRETPTSEVPMEVTFPGKSGSRTAVQFQLELPADQFAPKHTSDGREQIELQVEGNIYWRSERVDHFRYRWLRDAMSPIVVSIERLLLPDDYTVEMSFDDGAGKLLRVVNDVSVPYVAPPSDEIRTFREELGTEALRLAQDYRPGESRIRIVPPSPGILHGFERFDTIASGDEIASVEFWLNDKHILTRRRPPYTAELDLGDLPVMHSLRVVARNVDGRMVAGDEMILNSSARPYRVHIVSPRVSEGLSGPTRVEVDVDVPFGRKLRSLELYYNDELLVTSYDEELVQVVPLPDTPQVGYLRAVATLDDEYGTVAEDVVYVNAPELFEELDVRLVELPVTVTRRGQLVAGLTIDDFAVEDEGERVRIEKFEFVDDLPLSVGLAIDTSGSMEYRMTEAMQAAAEFFRDVLTPSDRGFVVGFNTEAYVVQPWTDSLVDLSAGLSTLHAEDYTALYDAIITSLYHFQGVEGQKALILLTDGTDTASRFSLDQVREYARRLAVPIYPIALGFESGDSAVRSIFESLAKDTGGDAYFTRSATDLTKIYEQIERELRSQYILGFYPDLEARETGEWREVSVRVAGAEARTVRGYYP